DLANALVAVGQPQDAADLPGAIQDGEDRAREREQESTGHDSSLPEKGSNFSRSAPRGAPGLRRAQRRQGALADLLDRADAGDLAHLGRARIAARGPRAVVVGARARLRAVHLEAPAHGLLAVVLALHKRLAGEVVAAFDPGRVELHVIGAPGARMGAPPAHAHDDLLVGHVDLEHVVDAYPFGLHGLGLRKGAREAVEEEAARAIRRPQALLHERDDDLVRDELPRVHHLLRGGAERRAGLDGRAQHVAGGNLGDAEALAEERRLGALAGAGRAEKYQAHENIVRTASRSCGVSTPGASAISLTATAMR